jgi:U3 small nucleolar RNA-associated protein 22
MVLSPPASISLVGSVAKGTALGPDVVADVAIEMPRAMFEGKDHLNDRFHVKRAIYISAVAAHLKSLGFKRLTWVVLNNDPRRVLLLFVSIFSRRDGGTGCLVSRFRYSRGFLQAPCSSAEQL